ncbi:hypothetical protein C1I92_22670 [Jiangella anatolica]|uniref:Uncharacterized protein n=2 Tax=Jiangella anatolica TaxID=2670374 RepID=A0A2W2BLE9_9ACTN|nr:hypothetical protein C1I92_22670 [Jiangella anatolica]
MATRRSSRLVIGLAVVVIAVLTACGGDDESPSAGSSLPGENSGDAESAMPGAQAVRLPDTKDPDVYAEAIAELVFGLSPADSYVRGYRDVLLGAIDPDVVGDDYDSLVEVTGQWIPDEETWDRQAEQGLRTSFEVESVVEPEQDSATPDGPQGQVARTVTGVQSIRYEDENDEQVRESEPRSVTVWVHCPADRNCSLVSVPEDVLQ